MSRGRPIGYQVISTWCRSCAPEGVTDSYGYGPMVESDGPLWCDVCGEELAPCEHEWGEWGGFVWGGEYRVCNKDGCDQPEYRDDQGNPTQQPPMPARPA